jgi:hypothetical protein
MFAALTLPDLPQTYATALFGKHRTAKFAVRGNLWASSDRFAEICLMGSIESMLESRISVRLDPDL